MTDNYSNLTKLGASFVTIETRSDLVDWFKEYLPGASVHDLDGEIIIHTGLTWEMNGELYPIEEGE